MLSKEGNKQIKPLIRVIILLLTILLSKNVQIEIVIPEIKIQLNIESPSLNSATKLIQ